jgi:hypothetical protein
MIGRSSLGLMVERHHDAPRSTAAGCLRRDGGPRMTHAILNPSSEGSTWGNALRGYDLKYARRVPRVRKFEWGSVDDHSFVPSAMSLASLSIGSQARGARVAAIGSFASSQPTSYAETSQRLLEPQGSAYLETKPYPVDLAERDKRVAKQWFSPNLIGNVKQRKRRYKTPASRGASQSIKVQNKDYDRRIEGGRLFQKKEVLQSNSSLYGSMSGRTSQPGTVASSTEGYRNKLHAKHSSDFFLDDPPTEAKLFGTEADTNQSGSAPTKRDLQALARITRPTEDLALLGAAFLVLVDGAADLRWGAFRQRAKQSSSASDALRLQPNSIDDARRRALHAFIDGRLSANVSNFTTRQSKAIRKLEGWVRGALAKADAHIADTYGPARTSPPEDLETV